MVARTCLTVTLYVHCLCCWYWTACSLIGVHRCFRVTCCMTGFIDQDMVQWRFGGCCRLECDTVHFSISMCTKVHRVTYQRIAVFTFPVVRTSGLRKRRVPLNTIKNPWIPCGGGRGRGGLLTSWVTVSSSRMILLHGADYVFWRAWSLPWPSERTTWAINCHCKCLDVCCPCEI